MSALSIEHAEKAWGTVRALAGVDLTVPTGALVAVLGPSGCGKTTLLRCISGLERLDGGRIRVDGREVAGPRTHVPTHRRRIALVPQEGALFPHLSVAENVGYGLSRAARRGDRIAEVLALVGLDGYQDRMPHQLSGGQQQRVALARALAPRPSLILLDEPFSALDAGLRAELRRDVRAALRADGATAVLVTHDQGEALSLADEIAVMRDGRVVQAGTPTAVYRTPTDPWVAAFVGEAVLLPGTVRDGRAETPLGIAPIVPSAVADTPTPVTVLIRPEQLDLTRASLAGPDAVTATVLRRDFHGHDTLTVVRLTDGTEVAARSLDGAEQHAPGSQVALKIRDAVLAWPRQRS